MASSITNDVRLDSPDDWDEWETALLNQAETYHILLVLQGIEDPIPKPEVRQSHSKASLIEIIDIFW
uniref:Bifunctional uridylyltransferase/uridylyl-removing enzyme n=1 Tax=Talaromyces marneffei PM1 TaxID=1077442 RepID=A0A093VF41_TALMA